MTPGEHGETMMMIVAPHQPEEKKLEKVITDMKVMGAPTIKAYFDGEKYCACEGSHRIAAAHALGLTPEIELVGWSDEIAHDMDDVRGNLVSDVLEYLDLTGPRYEFDA